MRVNGLRGFFVARMARIIFAAVLGAALSATASVTILAAVMPQQNSFGCCGSGADAGADDAGGGDGEGDCWECFYFDAG